jgi:hypothetical protein
VLTSLLQKLYYLRKVLKTCAREAYSCVLNCELWRNMEKLLFYSPITQKIRKLPSSKYNIRHRLLTNMFTKILPSTGSPNKNGV